MINKTRAEGLTWCIKAHAVTTEHMQIHCGEKHL